MTTTPITGGHLTFPHILKSEWTKFWSVRSTWWTLLILIIAIIGFGLMFSHSEGLARTSLVGGPAYASDSIFSSTIFGDLVMAILAVLVITGEYRSGEIRLSLLAVPKRWQMLAAKAVVVALVAFVITFLASYASVIASWSFLKTFATDDRFTLDGLRAVTGTALAVAFVAIMSLGVGAIIRNTAGAIGTIVLLVFVLPEILGSVAESWVAITSNYLIGTCVGGLTALPSQVDPANGVFSFGKSLWITALWALIPLIAGTILLHKRDA